MRMRRWSVGVAVGVVLLLLAGCTRSSGQPSPSNKSTAYVKDGTFRLSTATDVASFNPYSAFGEFWQTYSYDSLVHQTSAGSVASGLARSWQVSARQATFTLNSGVTCQDGATLTAGDVAAALRYVSNPKNLSQVVGALYFLPAGNSFTVSADDSARTVTVRMARPFSFIDRTIGLLPIVCRKGLANVKSLDHGSDGTGPYALKAYTSGGPYTFEVRNDYRWGADGASTKADGIPRKIVISVSPNQTTAANQLLTGELDGATINGADAQRLTAAGLYRFGAPSVSFAQFNEASGRVTDDPTIRKALAVGMDRDQVAKVATSGRGKAARSMQTVNAACYDTTTGSLPGHDLAAAKRMLDRAGWRAGSDGTRTKDGKQLRVDLLTAASYGATLPPTAELMANQWKSLGVKATVRSLTGAQMASAYQDGNWDAILISSYVAQLPSYFVTAFSGPGLPAGQNYGSVHNPTFDSLARKAAGTSGQASCGTWNQAQEALLGRVDAIPIGADTVGYFGHNVRYTVEPTTLVPDPTSIRLVK